MTTANKIIQFPDTESVFNMIDVGKKRPTRRRAVASGTLYAGETGFAAIRDKTLPKGDVLALAEAAGIMGAKKTPDLIPMCHTLPLDQVGIHFALDEKTYSVTVYCQAVAHAKTGVEMEALAGVNAALLTIWDLTKGVEAALRLGDVRLLVKEGGKSGLWIHPDGIPDWLAAQLPSEQFLKDISAAVLVMSDRAAQGVYDDQSGKFLVERLESAGAKISDYAVIPDDAETIATKIKAVTQSQKPKLLLASGGTGPGQRDVTPHVLNELYDCELDGLGEYLRRESAHHTDTAWLSRMGGGMIGDTLVIALPGSLKAVSECWEMLAPILPQALKMIAKQRGEK